MEENQFGYPGDRRESDPLRQVLNIGIGFFLVGIAVRVSTQLLYPPMSLILVPQNLPNLGWYETGVILSNWLLGLGSAVTAISCVFVGFRAVKR